MLLAGGTYGEYLSDPGPAVCGTALGVVAAPATVLFWKEELAAKFGGAYLLTDVEDNCDTNGGANALDVAAPPMALPNG